MAADMGLVKEEKLRVARMSKERFLIHLLRGLTVENFVRTLPKKLWDQGYNFQQWSLLDDAEVTMPRFKVMLDLVDLPMYLQRETTVAMAISSFGLFLGSVTTSEPTDCTSWRVMVAMDDINWLPPSIAYVIDGLEYLVQISPITSRRVLFMRPLIF